jgi:transcriptional regulator with XRE-family HTH domain
MYRNDKIKEKQAEKGWSNEVLAERAGVNVNTISAVRNGKPVRSTTLETVAATLGLPMVEVYEQKQDAEPIAA